MTDVFLPKALQRSRDGPIAPGGYQVAGRRLIWAICPPSAILDGIVYALDFISLEEVRSIDADSRDSPQGELFPVLAWGISCDHHADGPR
jgi:hypothetical protein